MTQTVSTSQPESTMHIPSSVLGIVLDTSNVTFKEAMKGIASAFLCMLGDNPHYLTTFLIATTDGTAYPILVTAETFEKQWQEVPWGKSPSITTGLQAMSNVMNKYANKNAPTPKFRTLLLTGNPPGDAKAFHLTLSMLGRVEIAVLGEGTTQQQACAAYTDAIGNKFAVSATRIDNSDWQEWARTLYYSLA